MHIPTAESSWGAVSYESGTPVSRRQKAAAPKAADKAGLPAPRAEQDISQIEAQVRKMRI